MATKSIMSNIEIKDRYAAARFARSMKNAQNFASDGKHHGAAFSDMKRKEVRKMFRKVLHHDIHNKETRAALDEADRIAHDPNVKSYTSVEDLFNDLYAG